MTPDLKSLLSRRIHPDDSLPGEPAKDDPYREWGDLPFSVSVFDHWLSEEEYIAEPVVRHHDAVKKGLMAGYLEGERRFEAFYAELGREGAYLEARWRQGGRRFVPASSGLLKRIVRHSLREGRGMDLVFVAAPVRVIGGWNRTDLLLPETAAIRNEVAAAAMRHGLHVLP